MAVTLLVAASVLLAGAPAEAKTVVTVKTTLAKDRFTAGEVIRPTVRLEGAATGVTGTVRFDRYAGPGCTGTRTSAGERPASANPIQGPDLADSAGGRRSLRASYGGDGVYAAATGTCVDYTQVKRSRIAVSLPRQTFDSTEAINPKAVLSEVTADAGGQVTYRRWTGSSGCAGTGTTIGTGEVSGHVVRQSANHQDGVLGVHEYRASYSGDAANESAESVCEAYLTGTYITGTIFMDNDANGLLDDGDGKLGGVAVTLRKGDATVKVTESAPNGTYGFFVTEPGDYSVLRGSAPGYRGTSLEHLEVGLTALPVTGQDFGFAVLASSSPSADGPPTPSPSAQPEAPPSRPEPDSPRTTAPAPARASGGLSDIGVYGLFCGGTIVIIGTCLLILVLRRPD